MIFTGWMPLSTKEMGVKSKQRLPGNLAQLAPLEPTSNNLRGKNTVGGGEEEHRQARHSHILAFPTEISNAGDTSLIRGGKKGKGGEKKKRKT